MNLKKIVLKSTLSIFLLLICQIKAIIGSDVRCASNSTDWCEVIKPINGNDESIIIVITPEQDKNTFYGLRLTNVSKVIPSTFFRSFPEVKHAEISPGVETISQIDFKDAKKLIQLDLEGNRLKLVPKKVFANAIALRFVNLSSNIISEVEDYAFSGATHLTIIRLNKNNLTIIRKATFAGAPRLERLEVQYNQIEIVEEGAFDIESLKHIFFESNRVKKLPDNIFLNTPNLDIAYFSSNGMTEIGRSFYNAKKLGSVAFRHSRLKNVELYEFVKANPHVRNMYMEDSGFQFPNSTRPGEKFPNILRTVYLTRNNISNSNFLDHLEAFKDLAVIDIAFNNITRIDGIETIQQKFPKIKFIIYPGNPLNCSWINSTSFDRKLFNVPEYHKPDFNVSDYSVVDGIYCIGNVHK